MKLSYILYHFAGYNQKIFWFFYTITNSHSGVIWFLYCLSSIFFFLNFIILYILGIIYIYHFARSRPYGIRAYNSYKKMMDFLVYSGISYTLFIISYAFLKYTVNSSRPYCELNISTIIDISRERCSSGFPSAHSGMAMVYLILFWPYLKSYRSKILSIVLVFLVGIARMSLAMHYFADVFYGFCLAYLLTKIAFHLKSKLYNLKHLYYLIYIKIIKLKDRKYVRPNKLY